MKRKCLKCNRLVFTPNIDRVTKFSKLDLPITDLFQQSSSECWADEIANVVYPDIEFVTIIPKCMASTTALVMLFKNENFHASLAE